MMLMWSDTCSDFLYKSIYSGYSFELPQQVYKSMCCGYSCELPRLAVVIQMSIHNIYYYEEVDNITQTVIYKIV